ncbi:hypothetical protein EAI91_03500 [Lacticaseibacillus paracasei]|nr:hypothetical protein DBQ61_03195 [Lactobacillus sp. DS22_6]RYT00579.1 hypothetical protein EAI91_03500 [Lacticaseibacillus paracasei]
MLWSKVVAKVRLPMHLILAKYWLNTKKHQDNCLDAFLMEGIHPESFLSKMLILGNDGLFIVTFSMSA